VYFELFLAAALIILLIIVVVITRRKKKLSREISRKAEKNINNTKNLDPAHAVLEAHKIFVFTLASLVPEKQRKKIRAAETIKKFADQFPNSHHVWKSHRLRNRIAHEPNINVTQTHAELARRDFIRALRSVSK
jgi:hypothetical protein